MIVVNFNVLLLYMRIGMREREMRSDERETVSSVQVDR